MTRQEKLVLERRSIEAFRSVAHHVPDDEERRMLGPDVATLALLRHYGVPTRLVDWTLSPFVAAYFAVAENDDEPGVIWGFDHDRYALRGKAQWRKWPQTTIGREGKVFLADLTAFDDREPPDWFVCIYYTHGFPRQRAQRSWFSMTARFGKDHCEAVARLLGDAKHYRRFLIDARLKAKLRGILREQFGVWEGTLFADVAGAAKIARDLFPVIPGD